MDLETLQADVYVWSPDDANPIGYCSYSGEDIEEDFAALVLRLGEISEMTANGKNVILPVRQISIHPEYIEEVKEELNELSQSDFFTITSEATDTICLMCEGKITDGDRIVVESSTDRENDRAIQFHCDCKEEFSDMLEAAKEHVVANVI